MSEHAWVRLLFPAEAEATADHCGEACPFLRCADCRFQTPTEPAATEGQR